MNSIRCLAAVFAAPALPGMSWAAPAVLYAENFEANPAASWTVTDGPSDETANFFFEYFNSTGVPLAPRSSVGGTHGLNLQANQANGIFGGFSVSPTGKNFTGDYKVEFDWWANFNGPFPSSGNGSTQLSTFGIGTTGTVPQWPGGTQNSLWFAAAVDGGSPTADWRVYSTAAPSSYPDGSPVYAATGSDNRSNTNAYYAGFGQNTAPPAQLALFPQQTGTTLVGSAGMEWHQVEISKIGTAATWKVDGLLIATVDLATVTLSGGNIFFGHSDTNASVSTDANRSSLLFTLIDNIKVSSFAVSTADFNGNGVVDTADYTIWRDHLGLIGTGTQSTGDANGDTNVDQSDYIAWKATFGTSVPVAGAAIELAAPEPSTMLLFVGGIGSLGVCSRRRQGSSKPGH